MSVDYTHNWAQTVSPRDQDEEFEGEGDLQAREVDTAPAETKYWRIQSTAGASKPKWRNCHTSVLQNETKMVIFGGMHRKSKLNDCFSCDLEKNEWREIRAHNPPSPRYCHTANLYKNQLMLVFGGLGERGERFNDLFVLDLSLQEWTQPQTAGTPPEPRSHHGSVLFSDKLIIFGGLSGLSAERLNTLHVLDLEKRPWTWSQPTTLGTPPTGRLYPTLAVWKNQLSVFAGYTGRQRLNDMHFLDLGTMRWSEHWTREERPNPVYGHTSTQLGSKLLVFGGNTGVSYYEHHVYILDFETMLWRRLPPGVDCPSGRRYHTAVLSNVTQKLYVYGGSTVTKAPEDFLYVLDTTLLPGLEEWTFDEAQDIIKQGIRAFTRALKAPHGTLSTSAPLSPHISAQVSPSSSALNQGGATPTPASPPPYSTPVPNQSLSSLHHSNGSSSSSTSTAIDIVSKTKERPSKTSSSPAAPSSPQGTLSSSFGSLKKRKKLRSDSEEKPHTLTEVTISAPSSAAYPVKNLNLNSSFHDTTEEQAVEAVRLLKLHFQRLKREKEELRSATEAFQIQQRRFEEMASRMGTYILQHGEGNVVKLNVGGVAFQTTIATLTCHSDSMLAAMFSGRYKLPTDEKGRIFIDRDGTYFRYVLNFLRDSTLNAPLDHVLLMDLLQEAQFYQLHKLVQLVKTLLKELAQSVPGQASATRTRLTAAERALSISELTTPAVPRTGTSPDFDDYWGNL